MAYNMRHRSRDMHVLKEVDPLAGVALAKEKLTRVSICNFFFVFFVFWAWAYTRCLVLVCDVANVCCE